MGFDFLKPGQLQLIELLCTLSKTWGAFHRHISRVHPRYSSGATQELLRFSMNRSIMKYQDLKRVMLEGHGYNCIYALSGIDTNFLVIHTQIYVQALLQLNKNCIYR